jgi:hypothetical protein
MTIKIYSDRIDIGDFTLFEGNGGVQFGGVARAENFLGNQSFQGTVAGFTAGGFTSPAQVNTIDKFPFATDTNASDHGDLFVARHATAGQSSSTHGYVSGGTVPPHPTNVNTIDKFPFATAAGSSRVGTLSTIRNSSAGQSSSTHGYVSGGVSPPIPPPSIVNTIDKFPFATDTNVTDIGDLTQARAASAGQSSTTHGYTSGGSGPGNNNTIDKFPFATDTNATDVGDITQSKQQSAGQSSATHGYTSGGELIPNAAGVTNVIDKFPFASDSNATDVGDLTQARTSQVGQSSTSFGYNSSGSSDTVGNLTNTIDKFPFSADTNATDVGDVTQSRRAISGNGQQD